MGHTASRIGRKGKVMKLTKLNNICNFEKGSTGLAKAIPGKYPLVTTGKTRKTWGKLSVQNISKF